MKGLGEKAKVDGVVALWYDKELLSELTRNQVFVTYLSIYSFSIKVHVSSQKSEHCSHWKIPLDVRLINSFMYFVVDSQRDKICEDFVAHEALLGDLMNASKMYL